MKNLTNFLNAKSLSWQSGDINDLHKGSLLNLFRGKTTYFETALRKELKSPTNKFNIKLKLLPDVSKFKVILRAFNPLLASFGIQTRFGSNKISMTGRNGRNNRYLWYMYHKLMINSIRGNAQAYWKTTEVLLMRSQVYLVCNIHHTDKNVYRKRHISDLTKLVTQINKLRGHHHKQLNEFRKGTINGTVLMKSTIQYFRVYIWDGRKTRALGVPTLAWRVFGNMWLTPINGFYSIDRNQHGFVPHRGTLTAWRQMLLEVLPSRNIYEIDFKGFFPSINASGIFGHLEVKGLPKPISQYLLDMSQTPPALESIAYDEETGLVGPDDQNAIHKHELEHINRLRGLSASEPRAHWNSGFLDTSFKGKFTMPPFCLKDGKYVGEVLKPIMNFIEVNGKDLLLSLIVEDLGLDREDLENQDKYYEALYEYYEVQKYMFEEHIVNSPENARNPVTEILTNSLENKTISKESLENPEWQDYIYSREQGNLALGVSPAKSGSTTMGELFEGKTDKILYLTSKGDLTGFKEQSTNPIRKGPTYQINKLGNVEGLPQGSSLSPYLSIIYLNYFLENLKKGYPNIKYISYADDVIFYSDNNKEFKRFTKAFAGLAGKFGLEVALNKSQISKQGGKWLLPSLKFLGVVYDNVKDLLYTETRFKKRTLLWTLGNLSSIVDKLTAEKVKFLDGINLRSPQGLHKYMYAYFFRRYSDSGHSLYKYLTQTVNWDLFSKKYLTRFLDFKAEGRQTISSILPTTHEMKLLQKYLSKLNSFTAPGIIQGTNFIMYEADNKDTKISPTMLSGPYGGLLQARLYGGSLSITGFNTPSGNQDFSLFTKRVTGIKETRLNTPGSLAHILASVLRGYINVFNGSSIATYELVCLAKHISLLGKIKSEKVIRGRGFVMASTSLALQTPLPYSIGKHTEEWYAFAQDRKIKLALLGDQGGFNFFRNQEPRM